MENIQEENVTFIKDVLLPEMVHDRCFCAMNSREFVEFISARVEVTKSSSTRERSSREYHRARLIINFSGEPETFALVIKLSNLVDGGGEAWDLFLNEEMFYNKITKKYNWNIHPKCYVADMGRYGRPVIVLEDLEARGYVLPPVPNGKLDEYHTELCLKAIAGLHRCGTRLKAENFNSFREFYAKLIDARLDTQSTNVFIETSRRISKVLEELRHGTEEKIDRAEDEDLVTICHGNLAVDKSFYFKYENDKPVDVKIIGWNRIRHCSIIVDLVPILHRFGDDDLKRYLTAYLDATAIER